MLRSFEQLVDLFPKAAGLRRSVYGRNTRAGIDLLLADRPADQRERILAGVVRHRLLNRSIFCAYSALPHLARRFAQLVPIVGPHRASMRDTSVPLIIATGHFGPLFFAIAALERMLRGRRVIVILREGALYLRKALPLLDSLGFDYVVDSHDCVRYLVRTLREDTRTVVLFAFDNPFRGRRNVPFLSSTIATSTVIARLADLGGAKIVTSFWLWQNALPRIVFDHAIDVERSLEPVERRKRIVDALYRVLEYQVFTSPEQWSGWDYVTANVIVDPKALILGPPAKPVGPRSSWLERYWRAWRCGWIRKAGCKRANQTLQSLAQDGRRLEGRR